MRPVVWIPLVLFLGLGVALYVGLGLDPRVLPSALIDEPAPDFAAPPLYEEGEGLSDEALASGEVVLVNVFASWCAPCRIEHPVLMDLAEQGLPVFGLNYKDETADARRFLERLGNPYRRIGVDASGRIGIDFGVAGVPETFVIGPDGRIAYKHTGPILPQKRDGLMAAIEQAKNRQ